MKKFFSLWLLLVWVGISFGQTITIKDKDTRNPVELVTLISLDPKASAITNMRGQADISPFKGAEKIQIRSLGYETMVLSFDEIDSANYKIFIQRTNLSLDEVVVSATRWRQTTSNVPSRVITIPETEVALQNPQTSADLLGISGKVFIQKSQQGGGSPMIRGFATNRLIYTVDGVRMNTAIFRGGNIQNVINLDPFAMKNTEVLFGPGSVIYGSDAIGGVMSFQTLEPQLSLSDEAVVAGKAITRYSSANNEKTGHFDVNVGWKKWSLLTSFSSWDFDHLRQGSNGPEDYIKDYYVQRQDSMDVIIGQDDPLLQIPTAYSQVNLMQKVRFRPNERWDFQFGFHYSETSPYGRYDRHNRTRNGTARYSEWNYGPQKWMMNNLTINHKGSSAAYDQLTIRLAQQAFEESRIDRSLNSIERSTTKEEVGAWSANFDFVKSTGDRNSFFYGIEYVLNDVNSTGRLTDITTGNSQPGPSRYPQSSWNSIGAYVNDEYRISDNFTLQAGLRYNQYILSADFENNVNFYPLPFTTTEINNGALTGSFGAVYHPDKSWAIKLNLGTAFRSPNVDDIGKVFDSEPGSVVVPNPDLEAEYAYNLDMGIAKIFNNVVKLDLNAYYTLLQNAMVRRDFQLNGMDSIVYENSLSKVQAIQNAAIAHVYGIQAGVEVKLPAGFSFTTDLNYQAGTEELDDGSTSPSRHAAPFFGLSRLSYQLNRLKIQLLAVYQGERSYGNLPVEERSKDEIYAKDSNGNNYSPAWYTLEVNALYDLTETFSISAGVENLTDQRYRPYSSGLSGPGRNFVISLRAEF